MESASKYDIKYLFEPQSVAVIGVSQDKKKIGHAIFNNIISGGYKGEVFPVSPKGGNIAGYQVFADILDIDKPIDCAVIVIPANLVKEAVQKCVRKEVKFLLIITSGFSEIGNIREEKEILEIARTSGTRIVGPNMFGLYSCVSLLNSTFSASRINPGHVAILTQSGALGVAMISKTSVANMGLSAIVSLGNKCDIDEADLLEYLTGDDHTKVIFMYMEGVKKGERLIGILKTATSKKPVIVIKAGKSKRGARAAASHTGALAGSDEIFDAIMKQCGVLRAESLEDAFNWCKFMISVEEPENQNCVIISNGGGVGVMATDACEKYKVPLLDDQTVLKNLYDSVTPSFGSTKNPIDLTGEAGAEEYTRALAVTAESKEIGSTIGLYCETAIFNSDNLSQMIKTSYVKHQTHRKAISYALIGGQQVEQAIESLETEGIPIFSDVDEAVSCMGAYYRYYACLDDVSDAVDD
jgi:acetyl coenzyme A synthetase (ADP forming)-like protein